MSFALDTFWANVDTQLDKLRGARTAADVIGICPHLPELSCDAGCTRTGHGFFEGSGGDGTVRDALHDAGWRFVWSQAGYWWAMAAPDGQSFITYVEGDLYATDTSPKEPT